MSIFSFFLGLFCVSQFYWAWRGYIVAARWIPSPARRLALVCLFLAIYLTLFWQNFGSMRRGDPSPIRLTLQDAVVGAPFYWWAASSLAAFLLAILIAIPRALGRAVIWILHKLRPPMSEAPPSPGRRLFLASTTAAITSAPFVAGAYGLLYGRLNLETTNQPIRVPRLPRAFEGFRICQLSDIHIGPFMPFEEIRRYVAIANAIKPDLIALTGDFVTFDPTTQQAVVDALSGLRAPFGVFGCLGNHDSWTGVEDSISELFRQRSVRMLRSEAVPITIGSDSFNLIGVDFQSQHRFGPSPAMQYLLRDIEPMIAPDKVNILLSHNPDTFDRAAELGIDLSLAGHTHGGQAALEFISPELAPSRLVTPYVAGWFQKPGGQLYVNRGIGTIGVPIRVGAPPEITIYKLTRG